MKTITLDELMQLVFNVRPDIYHVYVADIDCGFNVRMWNKGELPSREYSQYQNTLIDTRLSFTGLTHEARPSTVFVKDLLT